MATTGVMKFSEVIEHYRQLLLANPGKGLLICSGGNVAVLDGEVVIGAPMRQDGTPELEDSYEFDSRAFDDVEGCWDGETPEQTVASISSPAFIAL